jgi:hypothetical protein
VGAAGIDEEEKKEEGKKKKKEKEKNMTGIKHIVIRAK